MPTIFGAIHPDDDPLIALNPKLSSSVVIMIPGVEDDQQNNAPADHNWSLYSIIQIIINWLEKYESQWEGLSHIWNGQ